MSTLVELRALAKQLGIKGISTARKDQLVKMIETHHNICKIQVENPVPVIKIVKDDMTDVADVADMADDKMETKSKRKQSKWNEFLKAYRAEHGCTLREAMLAKDKYLEWKDKN